MTTNDPALAVLLATMATSIDWLLHLEQDRDARIRAEAAHDLAHQAERHRVHVDAAFQTWCAVAKIKRV